MAAPKVITLNRLLDVQVRLLVDVKQAVDPVAVVSYTISDVNGANAVTRVITPTLTAAMITQLKAMLAAAITLINNTEGTTVT